MRARVLWAGVLAAAVLAAAFLLAGFGLTSRQLHLQSPSWSGSPAVATGAFHVHTQRSDGSGTPDEVAEAAARAGLQFLIFTDHGDATRTADPPQYRAGVLCVDAVEISTAAGHYIAIGLPPAPYPLGGEPRDVIDDVSRLGGFGVAAHPESPKPALRWIEWTAPFDALEWLNADSEWRDEGAARLTGAVMGYPLRRVETIGSLLDRPDGALRRWDVLTQRRRVVSLAGSDAHGRVGLRSEDSDAYINRWFLRLPSYDASFRAFTTKVELDRQFSGNAQSDAALLMDALRAGRAYTAIDALASPAFLQFSAKSAQASAQQGDLIESGAPVELSVRTNAPAGSTIRLMRDGTRVDTVAGTELRFDAGAEPGVFRVEVELRNSPGQPAIPWLLSNPIWVQRPGWGKATVQARPPAGETQEIGNGGWHVEHDARSTGQVVLSEDEPSLIGFRYGLAVADDDGAAGPYSALAMSTGSALIGHDRLSFRATAGQPMRISVQTRRQIVGERWQRSIYLDTQPRDVTIFFDDMRPVGITPSFRFNPAEIDTVLFVVETTNTRPGAQGTLSLRGVRLEH